MQRKQKLKIKEIIDELDLESVKNFLMQYAKNDHSFEIAFKSHFISRIRTGVDENDKYKRILDEIIKPINAHNQKIGPTLKKTISIVLKDLALQMNDCLSTNNYTESYSLIKEALEKIEYLQHRYFIKDQSIERCRVHFIGGLDVILDMELAPAFRKKIEKELIDLTQKSYFYPQQNNLVELLNSKNVLIQEDKELISESLYNKIKQIPDEENLVKTIVQLAHPFDNLAKKAIKTFGNNKLFNALKALIREGKFIYVDYFLNNKKINLSLNTDILNILKLIEKKDFGAITRGLTRLEDNAIPILELRSILEELPDLYLKKEFKKIRKWVDTLQFGLRTNMYFRAGYHNELITMLEDKNDVEWIKVYDNGLLQNGFDNEIAHLYQNTMENYLSNHIGIKAKEYLDKIQQHLFKNGHHKIAEDLLDHVMKKYDYRISLN
ncbi:MAG: hypothetical protein HKO66_06970 [Saprospiraceae bacterium]|nr:hypothetical protein [Bacteroidia bacterium]NNE16509.1 hypothetical protein [Saprospiraceae bacterium]NNL91955.1 hypothetical protein [Saprospiraceae bacterium]